MSTMNGLNIDEISGERIKKMLIRIVEEQLNTKNVKIYIEHGSKKGLHFC